MAVPFYTDNETFCLRVWKNGITLKAQSSSGMNELVFQFEWALSLREISLYFSQSEDVT